MKFGFFNDSDREYVITSPATPQPWINYLGNEEFFSLISNTCGGYSFYKDAKLLRLTRYRYNNVPADTNGRYYFIKHNDTVWTPAWQPVKTELDSYECRHGLGYSRFTSSKNKIEAKLTAFVPLHETCEVNQLILTNNNETCEQLDLTSYVEFCFWNAVDDATNFQRNLSLGEVEVCGSEIYHKTEYRERRNHFAYYTVNAEINGFDTSRDAFLGVYGSIERPQTVLTRASSDSIASGGAVIGSHHLKVILKPGESKSFVFVLGYSENPYEDKWEAPNIIKKDAARAAMKRFSTDEQVEKALNDLKEYWNTLLATFSVDSADEKLNRMVNIWNQYQCMVTFNMSRSASHFESGTGRGMGFRDSCQDLIGFVNLIPDRPLTKKGNSDIGSGFNDDPLWLIAGTAAYIKETGDLSILDEIVYFNNDPALAKPLSEHLKRSFDYTLTHLGPNGLPLIGRADWNDCLNLNCFSKEPGESFQTFGPSEGPVAESVFIAGMFIKYGIVLQQPAYSKYYLNLGEISSYPPGYKENAGIFCHNNPWVSIAETRIGRGDRAFEIYRRTCPAYIEEISEIHRTEPYVYSQMIAGKDAPKHGEAKNSWLTGTAAWTFVNVSQYILGIRPPFDGLEIDPCIPSNMDGFTATRKYRNAVYYITVKNPNHVEKEVQKLTVNGKSVEGTCVKAIDNVKEYHIEVVMG